MKVIIFRACLILQHAHCNYLATPIVSKPADTEKSKHLLATPDAVINTTAIYSPEGGAKVFNLVTEAAKAVRPAYAARLNYVEASGIWVHGDSRDEIVTDTTSTATPHPFTTQRAAHEGNVVDTTHINGIVIRPALVIGRSSSNLGDMLISGAHAGEMAWIGTPGGRCSVTHQNDLAGAYLSAVECGSLVRGSIFDITKKLTESVEDVLVTLCKISETEGYKCREPTSPFEEGACCTTKIRPYLARTLLDWSPRKPGFVDKMEVCYAAWKTSKGL